MKESTKNIVFNALYYFIIAMLIFVCLYVSFSIGVIKGMTDTYKTQLKEQIRLLEQEKSKNKVLLFRTTFACGMNDGAMAAMTKLFGSEFFNPSTESRCSVKK